jgi:Fe-S-cluster containining protein
VKRRKRADREAVKRLEAVYAKLPKLNCKGLCQACCGPIGLSPVEHDRMAERGQPLPMLQDFTDGTLFSASARCPQLAGNGRCTVYAVRPMVCRLWGVVESMKCPHGCVPEGGFLDEEVGQLLFRDALEAGGVQVPPEDHLRRRLADPEVREQFREIMARGQKADRRRMGK